MREQGWYTPVPPFTFGYWSSWGVPFIRDAIDEARVPPEPVRGSDRCYPKNQLQPARLASVWVVHTRFRLAVGAYCHPNLSPALNQAGIALFSESPGETWRCIPDLNQHRLQKNYSGELNWRDRPLPPRAAGEDVRQLDRSHPQRPLDPCRLVRQVKMLAHGPRLVAAAAISYEPDAPASGFSGSFTRWRVGLV